eukprot:SAG25_NODE_492_length_7410_cov_65.688004_5_plen_118_part_00
MVQKKPRTWGWKVIKYHYAKDMTDPADIALHMRGKGMQVGRTWVQEKLKKYLDAHTESRIWEGVHHGGSLLLLLPRCLARRRGRGVVETSDPLVRVGRHEAQGEGAAGGGAAGVDRG